MNPQERSASLEPDQIASWVYGSSAYPADYKVVVAESVAKRDQYDRIVMHIPVPPSDQRTIILEIGPSNVPLLKQALERAGLPLERFHLKGLDPYPAMHPSGLEMLTGSVTAIPLPDASVDVVVMSSVLVFVTDRALALRECSRVLKSGGLILLSEPDGALLPLLSKRVIQYEMQHLRRQTFSKTSGWKGSVLFRWNVARWFVPRLGHVRSALRINKRIQAQQIAPDGFTSVELTNNLATAGFRLIEIEHTYAGVYFLMVAQKP